MDLERIRMEAETEIQNASDIQVLEETRIKYLGKKGIITSALKSIGELPKEERPAAGVKINAVKVVIEESLNHRLKELEEKELEERLKKEYIDITVPGRKPELGHLHPLTIVREEITEIFLGLGFSIAEGPEIEYDYYNFEALNIPRDHPARDIQDTFYINDNIVLRTHTSPVQVRTMERQKPPIRVIVPGRVYRSDNIDATHSPVFHQIEGLVVDRNVTMGDLKGVLSLFAKQLFGEDTKTKFRPHYFPFTEPSAEMDVTCMACKGRGCRVCGGTGWIEILGSGMVHPKVLSMSGIDPQEYSGFAFGMGLDRIAMLKYGIDDLRLFFENDIRFIRQF
ncbi:phenylalanine--tRNA ligase subunit alpha [Calorimonas adulescens]|uniref:Phenylalanine--tRNA ligase alpha subunit n=1 Tax=Calorimonas adulescens TaxID=2606906 RepID=A0A5D8QCL0_9THEO|nr:phenylalanine--tRNA ligase subunit alpha [Calorimonas adulescens]TZE82281.1 phenylalanine--tRNA ligase subunit alpha [Calorimonas adulescens]